MNNTTRPDGWGQQRIEEFLEDMEAEPDQDIALVPDTASEREELLASLRESLEDEKAGRVRPAREVLKEIALRHNLPLEPGEH